VGGSPLIVTCVGLVREGVLSLSLSAPGYQLISAMVPEQGGLQTGLNYAPQAKDQILQWNGAAFGYTTDKYIASVGQWSGGEPVATVGQGFFWQNSTNSNTWQMSFSPCQ
jgi:hypothetical protein